jgi:hypothetical protein
MYKRDLHFGYKYNQGGVKLNKINDRRLALKISVETVRLLLNWNSRKIWYERITGTDKIWNLAEICTLLNTLECTYEELFRDEPFKDEIRYTYFPSVDAREKIILKNKKDLHKIYGTRQNFSKRFASRNFRIDQINSTLDFLGKKFDEIFAEKIIYRVVVKPLRKEMEVYENV